MDDGEYMAHAIALAEQARDAGEVPVGAVVVLNNVIIGRGFNRTIAGCDPTAHAEIIALRAAAEHTGNHRLTGADVYVTLEPCSMCAGAMLHARIRGLIFGARDEKTGAAGSALNLLGSPLLNHQCQITAGVQAEQCGKLLTDFFAARRP